MVLPTFPQKGGSLPDVGAAAQAAEDAGVSALWACDHLFWHGPTVECLTALSFAASRTERVMLGTGVLQLPLRQPAVTAKVAASLQALSRGRLILGLGVGGHRGEFEAAGVPFERRGQRLEEELAAMRALWERNDGRYRQMPPPGHVPIWLGGSSDVARRRAAAVADGWFPMFMSPSRLKDSLARLDAELCAEGRDPRTFARAILLFVAVGKRPRAGVDWLSSLYRLDGQRLERHLITGSVDECVETLTNYRAAGATHLALFFADDDPIDQLVALVECERTLREEQRCHTLL